MSDTTPTDTAHTQPLLDHSEIPPGDYNSWTREERLVAEHVARCYANEYVYDYDMMKAVLRLGFEFEAAKEISRRLHFHWLTQRIIRELEQRFEAQQLVTRSRLLNLAYRDATDFGPGSNPIARVAAQKLLVAMEGYAAPKVTENKVTVKAVTGAIEVPLVTDQEEWEKAAMASQQDLVREAAQ